MKLATVLRNGFNLFLLVLVISCNSEKPKLRIGVLMRGLVIERCKIEQQYFIERINQLGGEAVVMDANEDDKVQVAQGMDLIKQGVDAIIIFPVNQVTSAEIIRAANQEKIPVVNYESLIEKADINFFVSTNNYEGGVLMAKYVVSKVPKGNYVVIGGNRGDKNAILIKEGNYKVINPLVEKGDIKKNYDVYADWTPDEGYHQMKTYLNLSGMIPDVVLSSNDGIAEGVIKALSEAGIEQGVLITGLDADLKACQRIMEGKQTLTIYKPFKEQAYCAVEAAFQMAQGKKPEKANTKVDNGYKEVDAYLATPTLVDRENIKSVIIDNKVYTETQLQSHP